MGNTQVGAVLPYLFRGSSPRSWGTLKYDPAEKYEKRFIPTLAGNTVGETYFLFLILVHPHARGEHSLLDRLKIYKTGSSPRSRGTQRQYLTWRFTIRFIPTLAGNTQVPYQPLFFCSVHPHARGEHSFQLSK